jgi:LytS/YehU family sensor histidine kinase
LIRYRLQHFQDETALLSNEIEVLGWYLKLQKLRYGDKFTYSVATPGLDAAGDVKIPVFGACR